MTAALLAALALVGSMSAESRPPSRIKAEPFALSDVRLLDGPFKHANKVCADYLLTVDPNRLLHSFRENAGLKAKAPIYEGWENSGLAGHSLGHYLSACAQQFADSGDVRYRDRVEFIVRELDECQRHRPDGYIAAMPDGDRVWSEIRKGDIRSRGFDLNGLWSPWYTHHKVLAGLLDANRLTGSHLALTVAEKFADWAIDTTKNLNDDQWQKMLGCEYGGMNDALAELYSRTHQQRYLDLSRKFYDKRVLDPLAENVDSLPGKHSNTQIPKIIGLARLYELTGDARDRDIAQFFWSEVVHHHSYVIGGNSNHEYLGPPDQLSDRLSTNTCETCNTYNMLKLTRHLFEWDPKAEYADYYERAHLNDILASQNPEDGMMCYFVPLSSGAHRDYSTRFDNWTCCHGSGMENHTKHADSVYFHEGGHKLYVNLFIPTELDWKQAGVKLRMDTVFPENGRVKLTLTSGAPKRFELAIRHPGWAAGPLWFKVNGEKTTVSDQPSSYAILNREWKAGDVVEFELPMDLRKETMPDNPHRIALLSGPVVLAADLGPVDGPEPRTPILVNEAKPVDHWVKPVYGRPLEFSTMATGRPTDLNLKPFYAISKNRYAVYFDEFTDAEWQAAETAYREEERRQKDISDRTIDFIRIGEMQPERDHNLVAEKTDIRDSNGRGFRTPLEAGHFEFDLKVADAGVNQLLITYWGNERFDPQFEVLVDGQLLVKETLPHRKNNAFFDELHPIPVEWTQGKSKVRIAVRAIPSHPAGSVAGARTLRVNGDSSPTLH